MTETKNKARQEQSIRHPTMLLRSSNTESDIYRNNSLKFDNEMQNNKFRRTLQLDTVL